MPTLSLSSMRLIEADSSYSYMWFRVSLDAPAAVPVTFRYFTVDGTASVAEGDYDAEGVFTRTIAAGSTYADIPVRIYGDTVVEADQTFQFVVLAPANAQLAGGAAALIATGTILDDDGGLPSGASGTGAPAQQLFGPTPEAGALPTLTARGVGTIEGDTRHEYATFLVLLDRPATADVTVDYFLAGGTAQTEQGDFNSQRGTLYIAAGERTAVVRALVYGDPLPEGDETYSLVLTDVRNAVFAGGASALSATGRIIDNDGGPVASAGGIGAPATPIFGPAAVDALPTVRVHDVRIVEGDTSYTYAEILLTLDKPAAVPMSLSWYTQDGTASAAQGDYSANYNTVYFEVGQISSTVRVVVYGDQAVEQDEAFSVIFHSIANGRFENGAAALTAEVKILEDDLGAVSGPAGMGAPADAVTEPVPTNAILPALRVFDTSVIEGNSSYQNMSFLVVLDRPATAPVTFRWTTLDGSASSALDDYNDNNNSVTIAAGQQSARISIQVYGDGLVEGNESFALMLYAITNATFENNAPVLVARGTILDDDSGPVSAPAGLGDPAAGAVAPVPTAASVRAQAVPVSVIEGNSSYTLHYIPVLLSEPARSEVVIDWKTVDTGSAIGDTDFDLSSGTLRIAAGQSAGVIGVYVYGDTQIEGDETFVLELTSRSGAVMANGLSVQNTVIRIADDDGAGTPGTGPAFTLSTGRSDGNDVLTGTLVGDALNGDGGNDTLSGLAGNDTLDGGDGDDSLVGGPGNDVLAGGAGRDTLLGEDGADTLNGGTGDDFLYGGATGADLRDVIYGGDGHDWADGGAGNDEILGGAGNDTLIGGLGADTLIGHDGLDVFLGAGGSDLIYGNAGADYLNGGFGYDRLNGGAGADIFFHQGVADHGSDWIQDYSAADLDLLSTAIAGAQRNQFQVNMAVTAGAGAAGVAEAFVIYRPTGQILFALVDGAGQQHINMNIGGTVYDLLA